MISSPMTQILRSRSYAPEALVGRRERIFRVPFGQPRGQATIAPQPVVHAARVEPAQQRRDVQAGLCDLAIGNTYYMVAMQASPEQKPWADAVKILFPNAQDRGTHVNITGAALLANAPNKSNGVKLIEYLLAGASLL